MTEQTGVVAGVSKSMLRQMMLIFLVVISSAVLAVNGWTLWSSWQRMLSSTEDNARNLSISLSRQAGDTFLQTELTLQDLRDRINIVGLRHQSAALTQQLLQRKAVLPQLDGLFIYDTEGNWIVSTASALPANANNADREYFQYHLKHSDNQVHIGDVVRSRSSGNLIIPVSMRLNNFDGTFRGVLLATIRIDFFRQVYDYYNLGEHDILGLMKANGNILYARPLSDTLINKSLSASPLFTRLLKTSSAGAAMYRSALDGRERIFGYSRLKRYPLVVVAGYDKQQIWRTWGADAFTFAMLSVVLLLLLFLFGFIVLRHIHLNLKNQFELTAVRDQLTAMNRTLQSLALIDGLTGLANRRQFDLWLQRSIERSSRQQTPLSLLMIDVDTFKNYNDHYGHQAGDHCLKQVAACLQQHQRQPDDLVARYGGEEFAIVLPNTHAADALLLAQQMVRDVAGLGIPHEKSSVAEKVVTISIGVHTTIAGRDSAAQDQLIAEADKALYQAKNSGKNQAVAL
ncbi:Diguanylate cyclase [Paramixta manurensis]|uniref:diguanylate cyclase n=1 Tax=Paramixta manurensis TaxID=2740817 RepID=A0A6M8UFM5_9GAMM|nr:Diguanylate cyclase [Erwiniaceae bacterium PD-1]